MAEIVFVQDPAICFILHWPVVHYRTILMEGSNQPSVHDGSFSYCFDARLFVNHWRLWESGFQSFVIGFLGCREGHVDIASKSRNLMTILSSVLLVAKENYAQS